MTPDTQYSRAERSVLWLVAALGLVGVNGAFLYGLMEPAVLRAAMTNPVSVAFMAEALILLPVLAYLLTKWGVLRLGWVSFVVLSFLGSMVFALPVALLWRRGSTTTPQRQP